ncbi:MAG TPA: BON domain-containing protein [Bryobacteraceae bacterium]|nr:BON domain-containing protein [Bryobacteraceae bacterium]
MSKVTLGVIVAAFVSSAISFAAEKEVSTFAAYVDSDVCARLMLGPITPQRIECSQKTYKDGSEPVLIRLSNNMILEVNKEKMINKLVGKLVNASGELRVNNGEMKLQAVTPIEASSIPAGDPARRLLDVRTYRTAGAPEIYEKIRHQLAMMPYISEFDFISFAMVGNDVILSGWTVRQTNRSDAQNIVKNIAGVGTIINNIDVLPLGSIDMRIRAMARAALQMSLARYFWGSGSDIKIVVKNGDIVLLGAVTNSGDKDLAGIRLNSIPGVFHVFNLLQVVSSSKKG